MAFVVMVVMLVGMIVSMFFSVFLRMLMSIIVRMIVPIMIVMLVIRAVSFGVGMMMSGIVVRRGIAVLGVRAFGGVKFPAGFLTVFLAVFLALERLGGMRRIWLGVSDNLALNAFAAAAAA
jgi:hypothetical protein